LIARALLENIAAGKEKKIVNITSQMGSITDNSSGGAYYYRSSKAALNMAAKSLAIDLKDKGIMVTVLHPGWVKTDMGGPEARISVEESVTGMRSVIAGLSLEQSGCFFSYEGKLLPW
jgi:NAD(P)-dependent dehydrogenase (short-subunit alcohol dehydrogenase family)